MSSVSRKIVNLGQPNAAAEPDIVGINKAAAREGARFGSRANAIQQGLISTAMTRAMSEDRSGRRWLLSHWAGPEPSEVAEPRCPSQRHVPLHHRHHSEVAGGRHM